MAQDPAPVNEERNRTQFGTGAPPVAPRKRPSAVSHPNTDDLLTKESIKAGTLTGSAVENVLREVLENRGPERLIGAELDGRYKIEKQVGEGGMGVVYLAKHMVIEKAVAIKVLRPEVAADESVVKRFVQEARAASRIGHPNIIDVTDFGTTKNGLTYQVMEFLEGKTLNQLLKDNKVLSVPRALAIVAQMARALGAAHDKGIVHRDLKPENVFLLQRDGRSDFVKIVDFGIAKVLPTDDNPNEQRLTRVGTVFGTPEYMAPEQAAGRTDVDLRADIYALGTILYEMLAGRVPHRGTTTVNTLAMQMLDEPAPMRTHRPELEITNDLEAAIMRSLAKKRDERYESMAAFLSALEEVTSKTELDLPLLMRQERMSSELLSQSGFDTIPEIDIPEIGREAPRNKPATSLQQLHGRSGSTTQSRKRRVSRVTDPAFLRSDPKTMLSASSSSASLSAEMPAQSRKPMWIVLGALLVVGGSVGAFVMSQKDKENHQSLAALEIDAAPPISESDAAVLAMTPDAAPEIPDAAPSDEVKVVSHKGKDPVDPVTPVKLPTSKNHTPTGPLPKGELEVTIVTRPAGAQLFEGPSYAGSDGLNMRRPAGTTVTMSCHLNGYIDGSVKVSFDGKNEIFMCRLREVRRKNCVDGVKNPFDDCP